MRRAGPMRSLAALLLLFSASVAAHAALFPAAKLDAIGKDVLATKGAPGLAIGVMRGGRIVSAKGYSVVDLENDCPFVQTASSRSRR